MKSEPWANFKIGSPSNQSNWTNPDCCPLDTLYHVAHVPTAIRILEDGQINSGLIFDKSKLNTERIMVTWLSPNYWNDGFRYGNVRFHFDIKSLMPGRHAYWVESIAYGVAACRILITDKDYSGILAPYDPSYSEGPWQIFQDGNHYYNSNHCLEIMFESDLPLSSATNIDFVNHHPKYCNLDHTTCKYKGKQSWQVGSEFIAALASMGLGYAHRGFIDQFNGIRQSNIHLQYSIRELDRTVRKLPITFAGPLTAASPASKAIARYILKCLYNDNLYNDVLNLCSLFINQKSLIDSVHIIICETFNLSNPDELYE